MTDPRSIRVALDVRMPAGQWGGVQQFAEGLAQGLSALDGDDEYLFLGYADASTWLDPRLSGACRRVEVPVSFGRSRRRRVYDALSRRSARLAGAAARVGVGLGARATPLPRSDGLLESLGVDVVHFVTPQAYLTRVPSLYQPQDLLHVHRPGQFSPLHSRYRDQAYRAFSEQAQFVVSMTQWGRLDLVGHFGLPATKIAVVPHPPVVTAPESPGGRSGRDADPFLIYPAQTWPHKNHLGLIEAVAICRERGVGLRVVCTGRQTQDFQALESWVTRLGLQDHVRFVGYVDEATLGDLYRRATALVFPSLFEGFGLPVVEAFASGLPVACSDIPVLREVAGDAALFFNPDDPKSMSDALERIWADAGLRIDLAAAGRARVATMSWPATAVTYRALYRRAAGLEPTEEDRVVLVPPTVVS